MLCSKCFQPNDDSAPDCEKCGALLARGVAPAVGGGVYAGFWKRFVAFVLDSLILGLVSSALIAAIVAAARGPSDAAVMAGAFSPFSSVLVWWLYYALLESSRWRATPGKLALGIKVVDRQGARITFGRATVRHFAKILSAMFAMTGFVMAGFTARKQALHDLAAGCLVVHSGVPQDAVREGAPAAVMPAWAAALLVLVVCVFPALIVLAVALPAYQDMAVRAHIASGVVAGDDATRAVEAYYVRNKTLPRDLKEAGIAGPPPHQVARITVDARSGAVLVVLAGAPLEGKSILFAPRIEASNSIAWICSSDEIQQKLLPRRCRKE